jgi:ribokinase
VDGLKAEGIDCDGVGVTPDASTGVAMIIVDAKGENSIVVASGANYRLTPDDVFAEESLFEQAHAVLLQLELPLPTVRAALEVARRHRCRIVLDPAPAPRQVCPELFAVDVLTPNAGEAEQLTGRAAAEERGSKNVASELIARGAKAAVIKLGARGSLVVSAEGHISRVGPYHVDVVDTTAAGDAFTAALGLAVARGDKLRAAARFANAAGALACTRPGAQPSMPTADEVADFLERHA